MTILKAVCEKDSRKCKLIDLSNKYDLVHNITLIC